MDVFEITYKLFQLISAQMGVISHLYGIDIRFRNRFKVVLHQ